jgi:PAS domain S-box-containing protein
MKLENNAPIDPARLGEQEFRELADHAPVMIWRSRPDKLCDWFNKPWTDFTGKSLEQLFGYGWAEDVHPDDLERCVNLYQSAFDARTPFTMPYRLRRHDGQFRWVLDNGAPYYRDTEFAGYFGSCVDITEHRDMGEHQQVLLAELNHRVKNNLQLIISLLQLSKLRAQGEEAKNLMQTAITRITGVGAVQDELHRSNKGLVDLAEYLPNLARNLLKSQGKADTTLRTETQQVLVSFQLASNLGLILNELLANAIKHGRAHGQSIFDLQVLRTDGNTAQIRLTDDGTGFSEQALADFAASPRARTISLIDALSKRCAAQVQRSNVAPANGCGAIVQLGFPAP